MQIELKKFKQHKHLIIDLPDSGFVLLNGKSGSGKTTILEAIDFALWGKKPEAKPWDGGEPLVKIKDFDIKGKKIDVIRSAKPNILKVVLEGTEYIDDSAQAIIESLLGFSNSEFLISSYVMQHGDNSLLNLSPSEMQEILNKLSFKDADPEAIKSSISDLTKKRKEKLFQSKIEYEASEKSFNDVNTEFLSVSVPVEPVVPDEYELSSKIESKISELKFSVMENKKIREDLMKISSDEIRNKISELESEMSVLGKDIDSLFKQKEEISTQKKEILSVDPEEQKELINSKNEKIKKKINYFNYLNKISLISSEINRLISGHENHSDLSFLDDVVNKMTAELSSLRIEASKISENIKSLKDWKNHENCPSCSTPLKVIDNKIVSLDKSKEEIDEMLSRHMENFSALVEEGKAKSKQLDEISSVRNQYKSLCESGIPEDPMPDIDNMDKLNDIIDKNNKHNQEIESLLNKIKEFDFNFKNIDSFIYVKKQRIEKITKDIDNLSKDLSKEEKIKDRIKSIEIDIEKESTEIERLFGLLDISKKYEFDVKVYDREKERYLKLSDKLSEVSLVKEKAQEQYNNSISDLASIEMVKKIHQNAVMESLSSKINDINELSQKYLDKMFEDDGTAISITNSVTISSGEEKSKIGLNIFHKGKKVKKIKELSGGERSRAYLSFQLGLSDLYDSPILMIDEGLTGLPQSDKTECLEFLKQESGNRLILVVEHNAPEFIFDNVLNIDQI